jgi:hypothetical protein
MERFSHPIQQLVLLDEQNPIKNKRADDGEIIINSDLEQYILMCSFGLSVLTSATEKAVISLELLERSEKKLKDSAFSHAEHIQFAIENYMIRSSTIYDRALIFVSHLLDLGIPDQHIAHEPLVSNGHVKRYQLAPRLKTLAKACREFRDERNAIIHHRSYAAEDFSKFALIVSANDLSVQAGRKAPFSRRFVKDLTDAIVSGHMIDFETHLGRIYEELRKFLDTAMAVYKLRKATYSEKPR